MDKHKNSIECWLDSASRNQAPAGESATVIRLDENAVTTIRIDGGQHFGSGGYCATSCYAGEEPEMVLGTKKTKSDSCISETFGDFIFRRPSIVCTSEYSRIPERVEFTIYVCATDREIKDAVDRVRQRRKEKAEKANLDILIQYIVQTLTKMDARQRHLKHGWYDSEINTIKKALLEGDLNEAGLANLPAEVSNAIRHAVYYTDDCTKIYEDAISTYHEHQKAEGRAYANEQKRKLMKMGFNPRTAALIMNAAGPGRAVMAAEWAICAVEKLGGDNRFAARDLLDCLLGNPRGTNNFGKDRAESVFAHLGIEPPEVESSRGLFKVLAGAKEAVVGIPKNLIYFESE